MSDTLKHSSLDFFLSTHWNKEKRVTRRSETTTLCVLIIKKESHKRGKDVVFVFSVISVFSLFLLYRVVYFFYIEYHRTITNKILFRDDDDDDESNNTHRNIIIVVVVVFDDDDSGTDVGRKSFAKKKNKKKTFNCFEGKSRREFYRQSSRRTRWRRRR